VQALMQRLGVARSVGLWGSYDVTLTPPLVNMFDHLFEVARHFDARLVLEDFAAPPRFSDAAESAAGRFVAAHLRPGERMLFVHPDTRPRKMWTAEGWSRVLCEMLDAEPDIRIFLSSHTAAHGIALGRHQHRLVELDTPFEMTLGILRHASAFVGVDSCFLHGADLLRIPAVGLFGPSDPAEWGFRLTPRSGIVHTGGAPLDTVNPDTVFEALREVTA